MRRAGLVVGVIAVLLGAAACGSSTDSTPPPTLSASAVPYLQSTARTLTVAGLAREAGAPTLAGELRGWGFSAGAQRYFQGESRRLQVVDSRTLRFRSAAGARNFMAFTRSRIDTYVGSFPRLRALTSGSRQGFLAIAQPCQCHLANPAFLAVIANRGTVSWLEINGPGATVGRLRALLTQAP